jgi:hypothetical protein
MENKVEPEVLAQLIAAPPDLEEKEDELDGLSKNQLIGLLREQKKCLDQARQWIEETQIILGTLLPQNNASNLLDEVKEVKKKKKEKKKKKVQNMIPEPEPKSDHDEENDIEDQAKIVRFQREQEEKKAWDDLLQEEDKRFHPLGGEIGSNWNPDNFKLRPVRHYADCYSRNALIRRMNCAKMLSSVINPYFYPNYKSTYATRVYIDTTKHDKAWLRDENNKWHHLSFHQAVRNMVFHVVTAYTDMIRREQQYLRLSTNDVTLWHQQKMTLICSNSENYQMIIKNLRKRIPGLNVHPEVEEKRIGEILLKNEDRRMDILVQLGDEYSNFSAFSLEKQEELLTKRVLHVVRFAEDIKRAKFHHSKIPPYTLPTEESSESEEESSNESEVGEREKIMREAINRALN